MLDAQDQVRNGAAAEAAPAVDAAEDTDRLLAHLLEIADHVSRLILIGTTRAQLRVHRAACLALLGIALGLAATALVLAGARLLARGLTAGLTELLDGRIWLAELSSGLVLLAGTVLLILAVRSWSERRLLRRLVQRHASPDTPS